VEKQQASSRQKARRVNGGGRHGVVQRKEAGTRKTQKKAYISERDGMSARGLPRKGLVQTSQTSKAMMILPGERRKERRQGSPKQRGSMGTKRRQGFRT